jgi:hypothetical protein
VVCSTLSALHYCRAERFLVAQTTAGDLLICAKYLFVEAISVVIEPGPSLVHARMRASPSPGCPYKELVIGFFTVLDLFQYPQYPQYPQLDFVKRNGIVKQ